jgi:non-specific protein-tyrosine kinase
MIMPNENMEKAHAERKNSISAGISGQTKPVDDLGVKPDVSLHKRCEVNPVYTNTRKMQVDTQILKQNKIVSLFQEEKACDQMRILYTQALNKLEAIGGNSLLITSPNPKEGKTTIAINMAVSISFKLDRTVLLIDANLRNPSVHHFLGITGCAGLDKYLLGDTEIDDILINPGIDKMVIIPGGSSLANSSELLDSPRMEALAREVKGRYQDRIIIYDCSSLLTSADPLILSGYVDGILLVVESEKTPASDIKKAMELLQGKQVIGTVLNKSRGRK